MIIHGNKKISEIVYARKASEGGGAVRLTNIIRGAQVVFGGIVSTVGNWLEKATKAAILAAFGQTDGMAVIKATNAYLNALAATDKTKASALAGFINEDPMLVCSLGLVVPEVTMPIYGLNGDGKAYMNLNVVLNQDDVVSVFTKPTTGNTAEFIFGSRESIGSRMYYYIYCNGNNKNISYCYNDSKIYEITTDVDIIRNMKMDKGKCYSNGNLVATLHQSTFTTTSVAYLFTAYTNGKVHSMRYKGVIGNCIIEGKRFMLPWTLKEARAADKCYPQVAKPAGTVGMIDIEHDIFYHNENMSGSFTKKTINPDGTPWTPLNQTP